MTSLQTKNHYGAFDSLFDEFNPYLIGLDKMIPTFKNLSTINSTSYPPYDIAKRETDIGTEYKITIATAGFKKEEISVSIDRNILSVANIVQESEKEDTGWVKTYNGIAKRRFERKFTLAESVEFVDAYYKDGLVVILLQEKETKEDPVRITLR